MGLLTRLLAVPVSGPVHGSLWIARKIHEAAEQQLTDPGAIRRELQQLEAALLAGQISEEAYDEAEEVLLNRLREARSGAGR
ncbi:gas vesicle protein [Alphaproteobacteria bacterium GH1-50]|uniref:Gas vesicle protein n=1 Tax=Kangsaoukella pontilimi TaxID=2691042 RepID=A0A7C9NE48_9RHOB|nr:gas vesicle protein GvpG [Kangsaoukella pontilimi]MXQ07939.1 gas vesicle protein [Kangsaoukella pontilimi]